MLSTVNYICLLYTSDAADERSSVDLGGRRIIKKKTHSDITVRQHHVKQTRITTYKQSVATIEVKERL